ncbi:MAG: hypothetical protein MR303_11390 [Emergencia sp.]|nr:hypothetical protein [Emergencia sp.]
MKKRTFLSCLLSVALMATTILPAFAGEQNVNPSTKTSLSPDMLADFTLPENPKIAVVMDSSFEGENISVHLPKELGLKQGVAEEEGVMTYGGERHAALKLKTLQREEKGVPLTSIQTDVTLKDKIAPRSYSFHHELPFGYKLMKSEDYYAEIINAKAGSEEKEQSQKGWVYILNEEDEIVAIIEPAYAEDVNGNKINTHYEVEGNTLVQVADITDNTAYPVTVTTTSTKPQNHKISDETARCTLDNSVISLASFVGGSVEKGLTYAAKKEITEAVVKKLGSKFIPILGNISWIVSGFATIADVMGYNYTQVTVGYEIWAYYKHQGGRWVEGRQYKGKKIELRCIK